MRLTHVRGAQCPHPHTQILEGRPRRPLVGCPSVRPSVRVCVSVRLSVCVRPSVRVCPSVRPSVRVCVSVRPCVCVSVRPSLMDLMII